jgi:hypothetical protein
MADNIPDAADCLRAEGWKQGCLIHPNNAEQITTASIDFYNKDPSSDTWLVVLTQDCDLVRNIGVETVCGNIGNPKTAKIFHLTQ